MFVKVNSDYRNKDKGVFTVIFCSKINCDNYCIYCIATENCELYKNYVIQNIENTETWD